MKERLTKYFDKKTILIVDDDYVSALLLHEHLKHLKSKIIIAYNPHDALKEFASNNDIALVLLDIKFYDGNGYDVAKQMKEKRQEVVIIAQTAMANEEERIKLKNSCFNDYIFKPINEEILFEKISKQMLY